MAKRITIKDISEALGVSRGTVDRALHDRGRIDPKTKEMILSFAEEMGYIPNSIARALVMQHHLSIAAVLPANPRYFFSIIAKGIREASEEMTKAGADVDVDFIHTKDVGDWNRQIRILEDISEKDYDGVIVVPSNTEKVTPYIDMLAEKGIPVVTVNNDAPHSKRICYVGEDSIKAGRVAGELLAKFVGRKGKVAILTGYKDSPSMSERAKGFESYFTGSGTELKLIGPYEYSEKQSVAYDITKKLIEEHRDLKGIYLTTTTGLTATAKAVVDAERLGDIIVIGPDMSRSINRMMNSNVIYATIYQAPREQGYKALTILSRKLANNEDPETQIVHTDLAVMLKEIREED